MASTLISTCTLVNLTNTGYVIGVNASTVKAGSAVVLCNRGATDYLTSWAMDIALGRIWLCGGDGKPLSYCAGYQEQGGPLSLESYDSSRLHQWWNWLGTPPTICPVGSSLYCVDVSGGTFANNTPIVTNGQMVLKAPRWLQIPV